MKKQKRFMVWFVGLFLLLFSINAIAGVEPTYLARIQNAAQVSCNVYEFDVVLQRTGTTIFRLANFQLGINIAPGLIPAGATCNTAMVPGSANALNALMRPTDVKFNFDNAKSCIIVTPVAPQGWANSTIISNLATGTKLCRIRVACSQAWNSGVNTAHTWSFSTANGYATKIFAYTGTVSPGVNTDVTATGTFSISPSPNGNITTSNIGTDPTPSTISADITQICMLPDVGATITIDNSQSGYTYYLYKNGVQVTGAGSVAFGTGSAVSFGQLIPDGIITVKSPGCSGLVNMTDSITLTGIVPLVASNAIVTVPGPNVEPGTLVTLTATPVNGGLTPMYQWYVNGVGDYVNGYGQTYEFTPVNGDQVYCEMYSSESCYTPAAAVSNTITYGVNYFPHVFNVTGGDTICQGATTSVILDSSQVGYNYDLYKDGVLLASQQKPGTGLPLTWTVAASGTYTVVASVPATAMNGSAVVVVNPILVPTFTQLGPYCVGETPGVLPTTSNNGIHGIWNAPINTNDSGSTTYTFFPLAGECALTTTMIVDVNAPVTPTFAQLGPYCQGSTADTLPLTSIEGINGTWSPAVITTVSAGTTPYLFTPAAGLCATTAVMNITVNAPTVPTFATYGPYCVGQNPPALPSVSTNGVTGTWSPASISTSFAGVYNFTFTPTAGLCATTYQMSVTVTEKTVPTFAQLGPYCVGATPAPLPFNSTNGVMGVWTPGVISTSTAGTTVYTYNPLIGQCATPTTMSIVVMPNTVPTFNPVAPICNGDVLSPLPTTSLNGINGTWTPALNNLTTTTYTFTPEPYPTGPCATTTTLTIVVNQKVTPTFTQLGPYCQFDTPDVLPLISTNGIHGTWNASISTALPGTTVYTFTPDLGECAVSTTMSVLVNEKVTPTFAQLGPYCQFSTPDVLPLISSNGVHGTWNTAISTATPGTTVYTFTPNQGECAYGTTMSVVVIEKITPTFDAVAPICAGDMLAPLPTTSLNGVPGTWAPALNNMATTTYTFTPTAGECAFTTTLTIVVNPIITPTFTQLGPYCQGETPGLLPLTSNNGITGTWNPSVISTVFSGSDVYTFTPTAGQCASTQTMTIVVNAWITPFFAQPRPYCQNETPAPLPAVSLNGIAGTWNPATVNTAIPGMTAYTFTPTPVVGQCATTEQLMIVVNPSVQATFAQLGPYCQGDTPGALLPVSLEGISGYWAPAVISTASAGTTVYTFTPDVPAQCGLGTTMSVTVNAPITPTFAQLGPYCQNSTPDVLPTTSINGYTGTWDAAISTATLGTTVYTFTPDAGQCATTATMTIQIDVNVLPTFAQLGPYCQGDIPAQLPTTSMNGYTGTWNAAISTATPGTTVYTFTPDAGQCATLATMSVVVNAPIMPTFNPLGAYTQGITAPPLPLTSLNGYVGTWNPAVVNTSMPGIYPYVFTPNAGQCASEKTVNIQILASVPALTFANDIGTTIFAAWPAVQDAGLYNFSYRPSPAAPWINLGAVSPYVKVTNLIPGTNYECMVRAYRANGQFLPAATIYGNFTPTATDYATSYDIGTTLLVDWTDYAPWASSYVFQYKKTGDVTWKQATAYLPETKLANLTAETTYDVRVMVYKAGAFWGYTGAGTITTGKVTFTVSNNTGTTLDLSYAGTPDFTPWASTYGLSYKPQSSSTWINLVAVAAPVNHLIGLTANTTYDCKVAIYKGSMLWGVSQLGTFSTSLVKSTVSDNSNSVTVYPNPFVDQVNMELFTEKETKVIYDIYDVTGNVVLSGSQTITSGYSTLNIDAAGLSKGVYMLRAVMNDEIQSFRIMKQ